MVICPCFSYFEHFPEFRQFADEILDIFELGLFSSHEKKRNDVKFEEQHSCRRTEWPVLLTESISFWNWSHCWLYLIYLGFGIGLGWPNRWLRECAQWWPSFSDPSRRNKKIYIKWITGVSDPYFGCQKFLILGFLSAVKLSEGELEVDDEGVIFVQHLI